MRAARLGLGLAALALGCGSGERSFEAPVTLNGREVAPEVLNVGEFVYMQRCRGCHGMHGEGDGPYASSMEPRPSDLTAGEYRVLEGDPPTDEAFRELITEGIEGSPMGPQPVEGEQLEAVVQYLRWLAERPGEGDQRVQ